MSAGAAIGILGNDLINPDAAGPGAVTVDDLMPILSDIAYRFSVVADVLQEADDQANSSVTAATEAATQIEVIGQDVKDTTERIVDTIIPHSLAWLSGYIVSHFIVQLQAAVTSLENAVDSLTRNVDILRTWRSERVDPDLDAWEQFHAFFTGWPTSVLMTLHDWLEHPDHFAQWAAAPLIGPLVSYLAAPEHKTARDALTSVIADAWAEESDVVFGDMLTFLVSDT